MTWLTLFLKVVETFVRNSSRRSNFLEIRFEWCLSLFRGYLFLPQRWRVISMNAQIFLATRSLMCCTVIWVVKISCSGSSSREARVAHWRSACTLTSRRVHLSGIHLRTRTRSPLVKPLMSFVTFSRTLPLNLDGKYISASIISSFCLAASLKMLRILTGIKSFEVVSEPISQARAGLRDTA